MIISKEGQGAGGSKNAVQTKLRVLIDHITETPKVISYLLITKAC